MIWFFLFIFGLCLGSFINCVVYRLNSFTSEESLRDTIRGVLWGRSICPKCKHKLAWRDNIPLLSFILLRGKCRYCYSPISWQYPIVELATGLATLFVVFHLGGVEVVASPPPRWPNGLLGGVIFNLIITYSLIAIFVSDLLYLTIPDEIVFPTMGLVLLANFFTSEESWLFHLPGEVAPAAHLGGVLLSSLVAAGFFYFLVLITRSRGMGMGDVKLAGLMGLILGWPRILVALFLAFLTGAVVGVILILLGKKRFGEHVPFGPFLTGSTWIVLFL